MKPIDFVFDSLKEFTNMSQEDLSSLKHDIAKDIDNTLLDPAHVDYKPTFKAKLLKYCESPWVRLALACSWLPFVKVVKDWFNSSDKDLKEEE